jgi:DNA-binding transcriptional LysR family regulator
LCLPSLLVMDLRQLECFVAVVDHGGFTRAAEALGITQPGVSAQVARLEHEVGERLFDRAGRGGATLTAAGRAALAPARAALASTDVVRSAVAEVSGLVSGRLALGHVSSGASLTLLEPLSELHERHPGIEVSLVEDSSERLLERLGRGELDLAWVGVVGALPSVFEHRTVLDERLVLGVAPDHPWAGRSWVAVRSALREPLIAMPPGTGARAALDEAAREADMEAAIAFECSSPELIGSLARRRLGIAVVPEPLAEVLGLVAVPLARPAVRSRMLLAWRRGGPTSPAARAFLSLLGDRAAVASA